MDMGIESASQKGEFDRSIEQVPHEDGLERTSSQLSNQVD